MELLASQLPEFFTEIGLKDVKVVEEGEKADIGSFLEKVDTHRSASLKPKWEQSAIEQLRAKEEAKTLGSLRTALIRKAGLEKDELTPEMTYQEMVEYAINKAKSQQAPEATDFEAQKLKLKEAMENEFAEKYNPLKEERDQLLAKFAKNQRLEHLNEASSKWALPTENKAFNKQRALENFDEYLNKIADISVKDGKIVAFEKGTEIPFQPNNKSFNIDEAAKAFYEPINCWQEGLKGKSAAAATDASANGAAYVEPAKDPSHKSYGSKFHEVVTSMGK